MGDQDSLPVGESAVGEVVVEAKSDHYDPSNQVWRDQVVALRRSLQAADIGGIRRVERPVEGRKAGIELIVLALGSSGAIKAATDVFRAWLQRDRSRRIRLTVTKGDGKPLAVELDADSASDATIREIMTAAVEHAGEDG